MAEGNTTTLQAPSCQSISKSLPKFGWQNVEFSNLAKDMTNEKIVHLQEFPIFHFPNHKFVNLVVFFLTWLLTSSPLTVFSSPPSSSRNTQTCVPTRASNDGAARRISGRAEGAAPATVVFSWEPVAVTNKPAARRRPRGHHRHHAAREPGEGGSRGNAGGATALGVAAAGGGQ